MNHWKPLTIVLLLAQTIFADQIVMKNGDRVTGAIVKKDAASLTVKTVHFGVVTVDWAQVESVKAETPLNIVLPGDRTVQGTLQTAGEKIEVSAAGQMQAVTPAEIIVLRDSAEQKAYERLLKPRLADLWAGQATIGFAGTSGNAKTSTATVGMTAARVTNNDLIKIYFNAIKASASLAGSSTNTAQAIRGGWGYNRNLNKRLFATGFNDWEYDRFQSLDLRMVLGGGLGYMAWKSDKGRLDLVGGGAYNREKFDPFPAAKFTRNSAEAYWGDDLAYKLNAKTSLFQSYRMFNNLSTTGRYRQNFDAGATTQLMKWLTWNVSVSDRFLSFPAPGRKKNDFFYTTGFGISFAR